MKKILDLKPGELFYFRVAECEHFNFNLTTNEVVFGTWTNIKYGDILMLIKIHDDEPVMLHIKTNKIVYVTKGNIANL